MSGPVFERILVAVDDSPAALAAARVAVAIAARTGAQLRFVTVLGDGELVRGLARDADDTGALEERRDATARALLRHVGDAADGAGIRAEGVTVTGEPARVLLAEARSWSADLVVIGRSDVSRPGRAYVGSVTRHVLELAEQPVLVVPLPAAASPHRAGRRPLRR